MTSAVNPLDETLRKAIDLHQRGELSRARSLYEKILKRQPRHFDALHLSGVIAAQMQDPARAVVLIGRAIAVFPGSAAAHCNLGSAYKELGDCPAAISSYNRAIELRPDYAEAFLNRSMAQRELGDFNAALASCDRVLELRPNLAEGYSCRGRILREQRRWQEALACFDQAIAQNPRLTEAHCERGIVLRELGQHDAALSSYEAALALDPRHVQTWVNRGNLHKERGEFDAALACFDQAIRLQPEFATAHANRSTILLLRGDYQSGWREYEWRWRDRYSSVMRQMRNFPQPQWRGKASLAGRTILLHHEQGLGDTLQFCRYATKLAQLGAKVILQVPRPLVALLASLDGVAAVFAENEALPDFDCHCPLLSLPLALGTTLDSIPATVPYLHSPACMSADWSERLGPWDRLRVGLVWSGGFRPDQPEVWAAHARRNIALGKLSVLKDPQIQFYSLQKGEPAESELAQLQAGGWEGLSIIDLTAELRDFADTAAFIDQLDLVISVDTSTAHLAGALGKRVWILNRHDTCWRWLLDRDDTPWYPTARLYRQVTPGDWDAVLGKVRRDLALLVAGAGPAA